MTKQNMFEKRKDKNIKEMFQKNIADYQNSCFIVGRI